MPFFDLPSAQLPGYRSTLVVPADFDAFWAETLAETRSFALDAKFEPVDAGLPLVEVFDVTYSGFGGHRVKGWVIRPKDGGERARSVVVKFIGYGGGRALPHEHLHWPATGRTLFVMDTRGQGSSWSRGDTADPVGSGPSTSGFMTKGIEDRAEYFYRRVFTDAVRAVEAARAFPAIDPSRVAVCGGSQGGGISIAVSGLVPDLKGVMPDVPFLCDFPRAVGLSSRDPYGEISRYLALHRDRVAQVFKTLSYFDGVAFAARANAPTLFSVALMDNVCPPSTVYAAYNAYAGAKEIEVYSYNDHEGGGAFQERRQREWLAGRI